MINDAYFGQVSQHAARMNVVIPTDYLNVLSATSDSIEPFWMRQELFLNISSKMAGMVDEFACFCNVTGRCALMIIQRNEYTLIRSFSLC